MAWKAWNAWSEMPETQNLKLRVVDPLEDEGIYAIIDDACNSCCHGELWRETAEKKLAARGFKPFWVHGDSTNFKGIGEKATSGKIKIPFGIELVESGMIIPGTVSTHEVPKASHPMLLSQACQAKLGMTKSMRAGTIFLDDYGQHLEVVRQAGTGLFMIRIDHLLMKDFQTLGDERFHVTPPEFQKTEY